MKQLQSVPRNEYCVTGVLFARMGNRLREWYRYAVRSDPLRRYHLCVAIERLQNYLGTRLPFELDALQHLRLLRTVFVLVFLSALAIHMLVEQGRDLTGTLVHAASVGFVYAVAVGLVTVFLHAIRRTVTGVRVWQVWIVSLGCFLLGHFFLPVDEWLRWLLDGVVDGHANAIAVTQLLPIWFVLTYIFIQPYSNEGLRSELARLRDINQLLERNQPETQPIDPATIHFQAGRTDFSLRADSIRNIVVEDHYCYVHFQREDGYAKRDLGLPLREVRGLLPDRFIQVHRSHIVNLQHVTSIQRRQRRIRVVLSGGYEVPVSRHRLDDVLPLLRKQLES